MKRSDVNTTVYPSLIHCAYRLPNGELFKRQYVGYSKNQAVDAFMQELGAVLGVSFKRPYFKTAI